jgi:transposase
MSRQLVELPKTVDECHDMIIQLFLEKAHLEGELLKTRHGLDVLKEKMKDLMRQRYGRRSEKLDIGQLSLFAREAIAALEAEQKIPEAVGDVVGELQEAGKANGGAAGRQRRGGKGKLPDTLPRVRREHRLTGEELLCPCGCQMKEIGVEVTAYLDYRPARLVVVENVQYKYGCSRNLEGVKTAPKPVEHITGGQAGLGLVGYIAESKHLNHLPLYRQEQMFKRLGHAVPRSSMCRWMREVAEKFKDILDRMRVRALKSRVILADETPLKFIDRVKPRGKTRQGYLWVYYGDSEHPYVLFSFSPSRAAEAPKGLLEGYEGYLITDGYVAYEVLAEEGKIKLVCCHAHARRGFEKAFKAGQTEASYALALYDRLYKIEKQARGGSEEERYRMRQEEAVPLLGQFKEWLEEMQKTTLPDMALGKAVRYCLARWEALERYTAAGYLSIDNNPVERAIRPVAIGRKNWMFCASEEGGETAAALATIVNTCKRLDIIPSAYIQDVLMRLARGGENIDDLLPDVWQPKLGPVQ